MTRPGSGSSPGSRPATLRRRRRAGRPRRARRPGGTTTAPAHDRPRHPHRPRPPDAGRPSRSCAGAPAATASSAPSVAGAARPRRAWRPDDDPRAWCGCPAREPGRAGGRPLRQPGGPGGSATSMAAGARRRPCPTTSSTASTSSASTREASAVRHALACTDGVTEMYSADPTIEDAADRRRLLATSRQLRRDLHGGPRSTCSPTPAPRTPPATWTSCAEPWATTRSPTSATRTAPRSARCTPTCFPDRVRAMVLDGVVDLAEPGVAGASDAGGRLRAGARALRAWCADDDDCPIAPRPIAAIEQVTAAAEREPIRGRRREPPGRTGRGHARHGPGRSTARAAGPTWPKP